MSRLTASSTAQSAACIAAFEPSMPTTIDGGVADSFIARLPIWLALGAVDRHACNAIGPAVELLRAIGPQLARRWSWQARRAIVVDARGAIEPKRPEYSGLLSLPHGFGRMLRYPYGMQASQRR